MRHWCCSNTLDSLRNHAGISRNHAVLAGERGYHRKKNLLPENLCVLEPSTEQYSAAIYPSFCRCRTPAFQNSCTPSPYGREKRLSVFLRDVPFSYIPSQKWFTIKLGGTLSYVLLVLCAKGEKRRNLERVVNTWFELKKQQLPKDWRKPSGGAHSNSGDSYQKYEYGYNNLSIEQLIQFGIELDALIGYLPYGGENPTLYQRVAVPFHEAARNFG